MNAFDVLDMMDISTPQSRASRRTTPRPTCCSSTTRGHECSMIALPLAPRSYIATSQIHLDRM